MLARMLLARVCAMFVIEARTTQNLKGEKMRSKSKKPSVKSKAGIPQSVKPRSLEVAKKGIRTGGDFALMMSALMSDVIEGQVTPQVANATVNAGGKLLKVVELQLKYGKPNVDGSSNMDLLAPSQSQVAIESA